MRFRGKPANGGTLTVTEMKEQIVSSVRQIDDLNRNIAEHWTMVQQCVVEKRVDEAISLLNAYYRMHTKLEQVEGSLKGILGGYFADK